MNSYQTILFKPFHLIYQKISEIYETTWEFFKTLPPLPPIAWSLITVHLLLIIYLFIHTRLMPEESRRRQPKHPVITHFAALAAAIYVYMILPDFAALLTQNDHTQIANILKSPYFMWFAKIVYRYASLAFVMALIRKYFIKERVTEQLDDMLFSNLVITTAFIIIFTIFMLMLIICSACSVLFPNMHILTFVFVFIGSLMLIAYLIRQLPDFYNNKFRKD